MATHASILSWRIPWTEEPGGLQSMGMQRVGHDWVTNTNTHTHIVTVLFCCCCHCSSCAMQLSWYSSLVEAHTWAPDRKAWSPNLWTTREFLITLLWNRSLHLFVLQNWKHIPITCPIKQQLLFSSLFL